MRALLTPGPRLLPRLALLGAVLLWAGTFPAARVALQELGPATVAALRFLIGAALLWLLAPQEGVPTARWPVALLGALFFGLGFWLFNAGAARTTAAHAALITGAVPIAATLWAVPLLGERPSPVLITALAASLAGMALVGGDVRGGDPPGDLLVAMGALLAGLYVAAHKRLLVPGSAPARLAAQAMGWGALVQLPAAGREWLLAPPQPSLPALASTAYLAVCGSALAFLLYAWGTQRVRAAEAGLYVNLEAVGGALLGSLLLGEALPPATLLGGGLIVAATLTASGWETGAIRLPAARPSRRRSPEPPPGHPAPG